MTKVPSDFDDRKSLTSLLSVVTGKSSSSKWTFRASAPLDTVLSEQTQRKRKSFHRLCFVHSSSVCPIKAREGTSTKIRLAFCFSVVHRATSVLPVPQAMTRLARSSVSNALWAAFIAFLWLGEWLPPFMLGNTCLEPFPDDLKVISCQFVQMVAPHRMEIGPTLQHILRK